MAINETLVAERRTLRVPFPASLAVNPGDLVYWDNSAKFGKPATSRADTGSAAGNQADFTPIFAGVSADMRLSTETSVTVVATRPIGDSDRMVVPEGIFDCSCASATFEFGDLVGIARDGTNNINLAQQVVGVAQAALAIGFVLKREPTAVTKVRCYLSAYGFGFFKGKSAGAIGYLAGVGNGGAVTQATNRTTGVTLNTLAGQITTNNASLAAEAAAKFTVTNSQVGLNDVVAVSIQSGTNGGNTEVTVSTVAAGSFQIQVANNNPAAGTAETGAIIINYVIIKGAAT